MTAVERLIALLDVEEIEVDLFRGRNTDAGWIRVYGGQVVAQSLAAAQKTVAADRPVHSLHAYFLRPGEPKVPILYKVERERDGKTFSSRRIQAIQHGRPIFSMSASFQLPEAGLHHQRPMPPAPDPLTLMTESEWDAMMGDKVPEPWRSIWAARDRPFEFRAAEPGDPFEPKPRPPAGQHWFRTDGAVPDDPSLAAALLAYASDMTLLDTCILPHGKSWQDPKLMAASLDHAIWFHAPYRPAEFHLIDQVSPVSGGGRGLNEGKIYTMDGTLVASVVQEGLIRYEV